MKLIIMGVGYVGMALLTNLHHQQVELITTTTRPAKVDLLNNFSSEVILLDQENPLPLKKAIEESDGIIVMVAPNHGESYSSTYLETAKTLQKCLSSKDRPFYILYTSSTSVYEGALPHEWVTEETALNPLSDNTKVLFETEKIYAQLDACILRLGGIYGPGRDLLRRASYMSGKTYPGTGDEPTNSIHLEDIVQAIEFCLKHNLKGIYNLVADSHPTRKELYGQICQQLGISPPLWTGESIHKGYKVSNAKIKSAGYRFQHDTMDAKCLK